MTPPPRQATQQDVETESSDDEMAERFGVTVATNRRRKRLVQSIFQMHGKLKTITAPKLRQWAQQFNAGTRHSYLVTAIAELQRQQVKLAGDVKGVAREAKLALMAHRPQQATPLTGEQVRQAAARVTDPEVHAVIVMMWKTASRLTSITQLATDDVRNTSAGPLTISMTFRRGKTILATGPNTLWAQVDEPTMAYIQARRAAAAPTLCRRTAEQLYAPIRAALPGFQIRSFRRGAIQELASTGATLDELRIVSKHISDSSLYRYLNFGEKSAHERDKVLRLTQHL